MRALLFLILVSASGGCISIHKTKIGTMRIGETGPEGPSAPQSLSPGDLGNFFSHSSTLDLSLKSDRSGAIVNLHLDNTRMTRDTVFFYGEYFSRYKTDKFYLQIPVSLSEIKKLRMEKSDHNAGSFSVFYDGTVESKKDSLALFFNRNSPFVVGSFHQNEVGSDFIKIYSGVVRDKFGNQATFYASTDPVPLILVAVGIGAGLCVLADWLLEEKEEKDKNEAARIVMRQLLPEERKRALDRARKDCEKECFPGGYLVSDKTFKCSCK